MPPQKAAPENSVQFDLERKRSEDFSVRYANNIHIESSAWDVKLLFGQLDQAPTPNEIVDHTAITISWSQIKLLNYLLSIHLAGHEAQMGRVRLFKGVIKEIPRQMPDFAQDQYVSPEASWKTVRKLYEDFVAANPELVSGKKQFT